MTLCDPTDCSRPGFPVLNYLLKFAQTHVHWVNDAFQPYQPLLFPSSPSLSLLPASQSFPDDLTLCVRWPKYWSFSFSISLSNQYLGFISFNFYFIFFLFLGLFPLVLTGWIPLLSKGLPRVFSNTTVWKHQFNNYFAYFCVFFLPKWQLVKLFWGHFYIKVWLPW